MARPDGPTIDLAAARRAVRELERELKRSGALATKAASRAMRKTLRSGKSAASKDIRAVINLKKKVVDERISTKQLSQRQITGRLTVRDKRVELVEFMTRGDIARQWRRQVARKSKGISVKVWKKKARQQFPGVFLNIGRKSGKWHALQRQGKDRHPVFIRYGPSITKEFEKAVPAFTRRANQVLQKNLAHEMGFVFKDS